MKCPKCQFENPEEAKFCSQCGNKMEVICPKCGKMNPPDSMFCNECGYDLKKPEKVPSVDYFQPQSYTPLRTCIDLFFGKLT